MKGVFKLNYYNYTQSLKSFLELYRRPVAIRFISPMDSIPEGYRSDLDLTFCQFVMLAQEGEKLLANADNLACANGAAALGLRPLPEKIKNGEMHARLNAYARPEVAARISAVTPRIPLGDYPQILVAPLDEADFEPHVVIIQSSPEILMWILIADNHELGSRYAVSTAGSQGICVDASVIPFLDGNLNLSLSCFGSRGATDQKEDEMILGIPFNRLEAIIQALPELKNSVIKRAQEKTAYNRLQEKLAKLQS